MRRVGRFVFILIACAFLLFAFCGQKAPESAAEASDSLLLKGKKQWDIGLFDSAYISFRKAQVQAFQAQNTLNHAEATYRAGLYLARQMRLVEASPTLDSAIAIGSQIDALSTQVLFARRERAFVALNQGQIPEAIRRYNNILEDMRPLTADVDSIRALVHESLGQAYFYQGNFDAGLQKSQEALNLYQSIFPKNHIKIGICANTLGIMYMYLDQFPASIEHFELGSNIFAQHYPAHHPNVLQIKTNIGVLYGELGLFWKSLKAHQAVIDQKENLEPRPYLNALLNLGSTLMGVGDYQSALDHFEEAEIFLKDYPQLADEQMSYIAQNRAAIYQEMGREEAALQQIEQAIEQNKQLKGEDHPELITEYFTLGDLLMSKKQFRAAEAAFRKALQITQKSIGKHSLQGGHALTYLGQLARAEADFVLAAKHLKEAQTHYLAIDNRFELAANYTELAINWRLLRQQDSCIAMHDKALEILLPEEVMNLRSYWYLHPMEEMMLERAHSIRAFPTDPQAYKAGSQDTSIFQNALYYFQTAIAVVDSQRHYYESPVSRQVRLTDQLPAYEGALDMCYRLYYIQDAFELAEQSKANNLRDHLRGVQALQFAGLPDSLLEKERQIRQRIAAINEERLSQHIDSSQLTSLKQESFDLKRSYHDFLQDLEQQYPAYFQLKFAQKELHVEQLLGSLSNQEAIYSYFMGSEHLYIFRLFQGRIDLYRQAIDTLIPALDTWLSFISTPPQTDTEGDQDASLAASHKLSQNLLPDLEDQMELITILPDGPLGYLPFESLSKETASQTSLRDWAFLGKKIAFTYAPAAELLGKTDKQSPASSNYLGFAPDFEAGNPVASRNRLSPLLYNQQEIKSVAKLLRGDALTGNQADEQKIKNLGGTPYILHFATHALADEKDLMRSRLFLKANQDTLEDGILYAYEIYGMQLNSPLCVLSACQTAKGPLQRGEGIMSLARAFQYSGCERVLSTLWQTDDRAAGSLSQDFFVALSKKMPVEQALLKARQAWLAKADNVYAHPYYWANYVLIGEGGHIPIKNHGPWGQVLLISSLALTLSLTLFFWRRKKRALF
jgi:CHAT domain-containing protein